MDYSPIFTYNLANISLASGTLMGSLIWIFSMIALIALLYGVHILVWYFLGLYTEKTSKKKKAKVLQDLVLMKDIQSEIEKEIEQARLKSAFQD